eukprot:3506354-Pleurochrysis_carterae.AAC.1
MRIARGLPIIGSESLFRKIWNEHTEIRESAAKLHPQCEKCGELGARLDRISRATDAESMKLRAEIHDAKVSCCPLFVHVSDTLALTRLYYFTWLHVLMVHSACLCWQCSHDEEHRTERRYSYDTCYRGESHPDRLRCIKIDVPTQHQLDLPCQLSQSRDVVKGLDGARKGQSKVTGAMASGIGMCAFIARAEIYWMRAQPGADYPGADFATSAFGAYACSACPSSIFSEHDALFPSAQGGLGARLQIQLDNTCSENKNKTVIAFLVCLVYTDVFEEAGFFCMMKGHTFTLLDQSFSVLIGKLKTYACYTISKLLDLIRYLPADNLPEDEQLIFPDFPSRTAQQAAAREGRSLRNLSERMENPPVNPITGPGRTQAAVNVDLWHYQDAVRARAEEEKQLPDPTHGPNFQADYVLLRIGTGTAAGISLHCVVHRITHVMLGKQKPLSQRLSIYTRHSQARLVFVASRQRCMLAMTPTTQGWAQCLRDTLASVENIPPLWTPYPYV